MSLLYMVALEDALLKEWYAFKHAQVHDTGIIEKLLHLYKPPHITCTRQLERLGIEDLALKSQLASTGLIDQTLEDLAARTRYKLLLTVKRDEFPGVCIYGDVLGNHYNLTCKPEASRDKAHALLKALLADARTILIQDLHLESHWRTTREFFALVPRKRLTLIFGKPIAQNRVTELKNICPEWKVINDSQRTYSSHHDRYLLIDQDMEVIITSGFDYLFDRSRECTLVIRRT